MNSYKELDIYKIAFDLAVKCHRLSLKLPSYELYELGSQFRRSSQSTRANIVEGYGRKNYKKEFVRFLVFSHASNLETLDHLEMIKELYNLEETDSLIKEVDELGKKIYSFKNYVSKKWRTNNN